KAARRWEASRKSLDQRLGRREIVGAVHYNERTPAYHFHPRRPIDVFQSGSYRGMGNAHTAFSKAIDDCNGYRGVGGLMFAEETQFKRSRRSIDFRGPRTKYLDARLACSTPIDQAWLVFILEINT